MSTQTIESVLVYLDRTNEFEHYAPLEWFPITVECAQYRIEEVDKAIEYWRDILEKIKMVARRGVIVKLTKPNREDSVLFVGRISVYGGRRDPPNVELMPNMNMYKLIREKEFRLDRRATYTEDEIAKLDEQMMNWGAIRYLEESLMAYDEIRNEMERHIEWLKTEV